MEKQAQGKKSSKAAEEQNQTLALQMLSWSQCSNGQNHDSQSLLCF